MGPFSSDEARKARNTHDGDQWCAGMADMFHEKAKAEQDDKQRRQFERAAEEMEHKGGR